MHPLVFSSCGSLTQDTDYRIVSKLILSHDLISVFILEKLGCPTQITNECSWKKQQPRAVWTIAVRKASFNSSCVNLFLTSYCTYSTDACIHKIKLIQHSNKKCSINEMASLQNRHTKYLWKRWLTLGSCSDSDSDGGPLGWRRANSSPSVCDILLAYSRYLPGQNAIGMEETLVSFLYCEDIYVCL